MSKAISIIKKQTALSEFDKLPRRAYSKDSPSFTRKFDIAEKWYVVSGNVTFIDDSTKKSMTAGTGSVITIPNDSQFSNIRVGDDTFIKRYIDDVDERNRISTNIKINYLIIKTILEISGLYDDFISVPYDGQDLIFESAKEGTLYKYSDDWNLVDTIIQSFADRTGISENVWYGKRRLKTGLKYNQPKWDSSLSIDYIDNISSGKNQQQAQQYTLLKNDPLDLISQATGSTKTISVNNLSLYTLDKLLTFVARSIKEEEKDLLKNVFPSDIKLPIPKNTSEYLNKKGMPPYLLYGQEISTVIKQLFWTTSVGYENRMELRDSIT